MIDGPSPIDLRVSDLRLSPHPSMPLNPAESVDPSRATADNRPRRQGTMLVSLMNLSDRHRTIERFDLQPVSGTEWAIDPVSRRVRQMIDSGKDLELELTVNVVPGRMFEPNRAPVSRMVAMIVLQGGEVYRLNLEVPISGDLR